MKSERAPSVLGAVENRRSYIIYRDFILDEGMKAVNFETPDFGKNGKELLEILFPNQRCRHQFIAGDFPFCDNAIPLCFLK